MGASAVTFEFFKDVPKDESISEEVRAYQADFNECKGLIPATAMPAMLGVSRQRWHQLREKYDFKIYHHFGKEFVSYPVAIEFVQLQRPDGPADPAKAIQAIMQDMVKD